MDNGGDILQLCRLCLVKDQVNIPIFEEQGDIRQIFLKISSCLPVKVTPDDKLPKKICDGCSCKLDMLYEFWNTTANAEKQLVSWLDQAGLKANTETADQTMSVVAQQVSSKPSETVVKEEAADEIFMEEITFSEKWEEASSSAGPSATITSDEPPPKRARRAAAVRASLNVAAESDDEDDLDTELTKIEDESEDEDDAEVDDPSYVDAPSTSADDQPGPSGVGKDGGDAPIDILQIKTEITIDEDSSELKDLANNIKIKTEMTTDEDSLEFKDLTNNIKLEHEFQELEPTITNFIFNTEPVEHNGEAEQSGTDIANKYMNIFCDMCDARFSNIFRLKVHINKVHKDKKNRPKDHLCETCGKSFRCQSLLFDHRVIHTGEEKRHTCELCKKKFAQQSNLRGHLKIHARPFSCHVCNRRFLTNEALLAHLKSSCEKSKYCVQCKEDNDTKIDGKCNHKPKREIRLYLCDTCGKIYKESMFRAHLRAHKGEKPYICKTCNKGFTMSQRLKEHERVHSGERPYVCTTCGRGFTQRAPLKLHIRTHTGERPYPCDLCRKGFISKAAKDNHMKSCSKNNKKNKK